jgi:hypothetical protein
MSKSYFGAVCQSSRNLVTIAQFREWVRKKVDHYDGDKLSEFDEHFCGGDLYESCGSCEDDPPEEDILDDLVRERVFECLVDAWEELTNGQLYDYWRFEVYGKEFIASGGVSYGDVPTDSYDAVNMMAWVGYDDLVNSIDVERHYEQVLDLSTPEARFRQRVLQFLRETGQCGYFLEFFEKKEST